MFDKLKFWKKRVTAAVTGEPLSLWDQVMGSKTCVTCKHNPISLYEGPSGGMSQNIFCGWCGQGYNCTPMLERLELISVDERYACDNEQVVARQALKEKFAS